jgi:hypothetical protein
MHSTMVCNWALSFNSRSLATCLFAPNKRLAVLAESLAPSSLAGARAPSFLRLFIPVIQISDAVSSSTKGASSRTRFPTFLQTHLCVPLIDSFLLTLRLRSQTSKPRLRSCSFSYVHDLIFQCVNSACPPLARAATSSANQVYW